MDTNQWQPIETAPRDGTAILIWLLPDTCRIVFYCGGRPGFVWVEVDGNNIWNERHATHWMPLPEPPQGDEND